VTKENIVEIPEGSGNRYKYAYDPGSKSTVYKGPVGSAPDITEEEWQRNLEETEAYWAVKKASDGTTITTKYHKVPLPEAIDRTKANIKIHGMGTADHIEVIDADKRVHWSTEPDEKWRWQVVIPLTKLQEDAFTHMAVSFRYSGLVRIHKYPKKQFAVFDDLAVARDFRSIIKMRDPETLEHDLGIKYREITNIDHKLFGEIHRKTMEGPPKGKYPYSREPKVIEIEIEEW